MAAELALVLLYALAFSIDAFSGVERLPTWVTGLTPYLAVATDPIPAGVGLLIAIYYALSVTLILCFIVARFRRRTTPLNLQWLLGMAVGLPVLLSPWLVGANLRTIKMGELHLGNVWGHLAAALGISFVAAFFCARAFNSMKNRDASLPTG